MASPSTSTSSSAAAEVDDIIIRGPIGHLVPEVDVAVKLVNDQKLMDLKELDMIRLDIIY